MRELRRAADDPEFLLKALGEASGELRRTVLSVPPALYTRPGASYPDDQWSLHAIAFHMLQVEEGVRGQIERITEERQSTIPHVDLDDIPFAEDYEHIHIEFLLEEFHFQRQHTAYTLWNIYDHDWRRSATHPYRGEMTVTQLVRELYQHDLEHLWQAQRMVGAFAAAHR